MKQDQLNYIKNSFLNTFIFCTFVNQIKKYGGVTESMIFYYSIQHFKEVKLCN